MSSVTQSRKRDFHAVGVSNCSRSAWNRRRASWRSGVASTVSILRLEDFPAVFLDQHAEDFAHAPAGRAFICNPLGRSLQQRDAAVANHADRAGIAIEGLQLEAGEINALELFGGVHKGSN